MSNELIDTEYMEAWKPEPKPSKPVAVMSHEVPEVALKEDVVEMFRSNVPEVARHAMELALQSDKPAEVMAMLQVMLDRVYGKAVQQVQADIRSMVLQKIEVNFVE